ncbi:MAG: hypothetical protein A2086_08025 [Spirochaetes bacterium GWD1_27_9]|nr:MAG: hypothetical protein A2Z98_07155 [Spirochaetes bacterium GWB1_27_13]OHD25153.1 MAG: hypothetical protein A2Y34_16835 [Spirochaetes bacterium GWC1_27_15]OHD34469.1 MAG: hypothetical protein A2086_08025 [Spirochaetes bacterium GWD1_27_9]
MDLKFKKISIEDKSIFDKYFSSKEMQISEYTFTNLFIWRNTRQIEFCEYNGGLIILANYNNDKYFLPPIGFTDYKKIIFDLMEYAKKNNIPPVIKRLCEVKTNLLKDSGLDIIEDRDNFDYVYLSNDLAHLGGRKYSPKRNFITNFFSEYEFKFQKYEAKFAEQCLILAEDWINKKETEDKSLHNELLAIKELINNQHILNTDGCIILVDNKVEAFCFGERLDSKTYVVHFEKANSDLKGIYQTINKLHIEKIVDGKFKYVNREQDLGIAGIRKAKESYFPTKMIKKYNIALA